MGSFGTLEKARSEGWTDEAVVERVKAGDTALYELLMRRYNLCETGVPAGTQHVRGNLDLVLCTPQRLV